MKIISFALVKFVPLLLQFGPVVLESFDLDLAALLVCAHGNEAGVGRASILGMLHN